MLKDLIKSFKKIKKKYKLFIIVGFAFLISYLYLKDVIWRVDEIHNYTQIEIFFNGDFRMNPPMTMIPGYHLFLSVFAVLFNNISYPFLRFLNVIISSISVLVFYLISRELDNKNSYIKTLQFAFLPAIFSFVFLIYTESLSILLILLSFLFLIKKNYVLSGLIASIDILVRQNNIVWLAFLLVYLFLQEFSYKINFKNVIDFLQKAWSFFFGVGIFLIFLFLNKGAAIGDSGNHPIALHAGNVFYLIVLSSILFLPIFVSKFKEVQNFIKSKKVIVFLVSLLVFLLYIFTFKNDHQYNQGFPSFYIRNNILELMDYNIFSKLVFSIPIIYFVLSLFTIKSVNKKMWIIYVFSVLFLIPSWLVDSRYGILPMVFFGLFRCQESEKVEKSVLWLFIAIDLVLLYGLASERYFL